MSLHNAQEFDNDLGAWMYKYLAFASFLGVVDRIECIVQDAGLNHDCGIEEGGKP